MIIPCRPRRLAARIRLVAVTAAGAVAITACVWGSVVGFAGAELDTSTTTPADTSPSSTTGYATADTTRSAAAAAGQPGLVYANRDIPASRLIDAAAHGSQFTYWSTGADGGAHLSTGSLFLPRAKAPRAGYPVVAWAHGSRGIADSCAPSVRRTDTDLEALRALLNRGYAVVSTDYTGVGTAGTPQYFDLDTTARNIIDAVRAGHDVSNALSSTWAVVGEGQGASAAIEIGRTAAAAQGEGLDFRGSAATSIPAGFGSLIATLSPSTNVAAPPAWIADALFTLGAINNAHPEVGLDRYLSESGRRWLSKAQTLCAAELTRAVSGVRPGSLVAKPLADNAELSQLLTAATNLPTQGFTRPVLLTQTLQDPSVVVPLTLKYLAEAKSADADVDARTYVTLDRRAAAASATNDTRAFLTRVLR